MVKAVAPFRGTRRVVQMPPGQSACTAMASLLILARDASMRLMHKPILPTGSILRAAREAAQASHSGAVVGGAGPSAPSSLAGRAAPMRKDIVAEEVEEAEEA